MFQFSGFNLEFTFRKKIANRIFLRTLGIKNRLKRYLPFSAMELMYASLISSHLQFGITCWGFECNRIFKLQKRTLRIMTNSKYNAHTKLMFRELEMLKLRIYLIVSVWNSGTNLWASPFLNILARWLHSILIYTKRNTWSEATPFVSCRTISGSNDPTHHIPDLFLEYSRAKTQRDNTHSMNLLSHCLWHMFLDRIVMYVLISIVFSRRCNVTWFLLF